MNQFNFRIGNIEARTVSLRETVEIIQWSENSCWVIVSFVQNGDGRWDAVFVGKRPLEERVNWKHLGELIKASYDYLGE